MTQLDLQRNTPETNPSVVQSVVIRVPYLPNFISQLGRIATLRFVSDVLLWRSNYVIFFWPWWCFDIEVHDRERLAEDVDHGWKISSRILAWSS